MNFLSKTGKKWQFSWRGFVELIDDVYNYT